MDDRGTPLNQTPVINEKDIDLYKLFKVFNITWLTNLVQ